MFVLDAGEHDMVFTGDACKNRAELLSRSADLTFDPALSRASIEAIWSLWTRRAGSILVPGHDLPMVHDGEPRYLGRREAAISAWYGDDLNEITVISCEGEAALVCGGCHRNVPRTGPRHRSVRSWAAHAATPARQGRSRVVAGEPGVRHLGPGVAHAPSDPAARPDAPRHPHES